MSRTSTDSDTVSTSDLLDLIQEDDGVNYSDGKKRGPAALYKSHSHSSERESDSSYDDMQRNNTSRNYSTRLNDNFKSSSNISSHSGGSGGQRFNNYNVGASRNLSASSSSARRTTTSQQQHQNDSIISNDIFSVRLTSSRRRKVSVDSPDGSPLFGSDDESEDDDSVGDMSGFDMYKKFDNKSGRRTKQHGGSSSSVKRVSHNGLPTATTKKKAAAKNTRQRMPHSGGYGGMFDDPDNSVAADSSYGGGGGDSYTVESGTSQTTGLTSNNSESSSLSGSIFSFTSKLFSNKRYHRKKNPYHGGGGNSTVSGTSRTSRSTWQSSNEHFYNSFIHKAARTYISLPFRIRYFIQMFSIVGVFCMASLNYFIAMENNPGYAKAIAKANGGNNSLQVKDNVWMEGGGLKNHHIPRLRMRHVDPIKFLYHDLHPNELLERAQEKLRESTRFGELPPLDGEEDGEDIDGDADEMSRNINGHGGGGGEQAKGQGPFVYGWKSMPRQIYNDFSSGLSDDSKTIQNPHNTGYFHNKAEKKGMVGGGNNMQHEGDDGKNRPPPKGTVAYVLPIPTCYAQDKGDAINYHPYSPNHPRDESSFRDFAMMLRAMIHANSYRNSASGSVYDYKMHAIIHPRAKKCRSATEDLFSPRDGSEGGQEGLEDDPLNRGMVDRSVVLQNLGYHISLKYPPLSKSDLAGSDMHSIDTVDLIRLYAYELEEYDAVVLVDYDTLVVAPVDKAVDLIVDSSSDDDDNGSGQVNNIDAVFSWEHVPSLVNSKARASVINLSFFALRPSKDTFQKLLIRYKNAQFSEPRGWGTIGRGSFPGWMTTQGFLTYYYDEVANAAKVETNRCAFGNTGEKFDENNSILVTNGGKVDCTSSTADSQCKDCSKTKFRNVVVADLSYCRAAWECGGDEDGDGKVVSHDKILSSNMCRLFLRKWFNGRLQMEDVHPQLEKGNGKLCIDGKYQPMMLLKPNTSYKPNFLNRLG